MSRPSHDAAVQRSQDGKPPVQSLRSAEFFVYKREYRGRDAYNNKCRDRSPDGVGFGEFPNGENAEHGARDQRDRNHRKCDPADNLGIYDAARVGL